MIAVTQVVVFFFAPWCGSCTTLSPRFDVLAQKDTDVIFFKVDADMLPV